MRDRQDAPCPTPYSESETTREDQDGWSQIPWVWRGSMDL